MNIMVALLRWTQASSFELAVRLNHGHPHRGQNGHLPLPGNSDICPSLGIRTKNQNFLEKLTSAAQFRLIDLFLAMAVYLPLWHSHRVRGKFTVLVSVVNLEVHSCPLLCLQRQVAKLSSGLFYCRSLLCDNNTTTNLMFTSNYDIRRFAACDC